MSTSAITDEEVFQTTRQQDVVNKLAVANQKKDAGDSAFKAGDVKGGQYRAQIL